MGKITRKNVTTNLVWKLLERFGAQGVSFVVSIILARLLNPEVYGTIALVTVFITILQVFVDAGLGNALIQKKDADDVDFSTVFFFNIGFCALIYLLLFLCAPWISHFYGIPELTAIVRVLGLTIIISSMRNIQQAYVSKTLQFKRFFWATIGSTIGSAVLGIWLAYRGYGVWALVAQNISGQLVGTIILWCTVKWRPKPVFSAQRLKGLFSFGWKLLVGRLIETFYLNIKPLIIGKIYTTSDLAYFNKGNQMPNLLVTNIDSSIESVFFPVMSAEQDDKQRVKSILRRLIQVNTYILCPMMVGLMACAQPLITLLLTEKWISSVPYTQMFCFIYMFTVFNTANMNTYRSLGRSDIYLKVEVARKIVGFVTLLLVIRISVYAMVVAEAVTVLISLFINTYPNKKLLNYGFLQQLKDMLPALLLSVAMGVPVYLLTYTSLPLFLLLVLQVVLGVGIYVGLSVLFKPEAFRYLLGYIRRKK